MNQYKKDYIDTGSAKPLYDVLIYGFIGAYALAWPQEYAHYKHEQVRAQLGRRLGTWAGP